MEQSFRVFIMVVEERNFSRAAEKLHMTQPAVSQYIKSLEEHYGVKLLDRTNQYVHLTKAGDIVYVHAKKILALYSKIHHVIEDLTNQARGPLSIGASYTFGEYVLPYIVAKMNIDYPDIKPNIFINNTKEILTLVANHQLDIGIIEGEATKTDVHIETFAEDKMVIVASSEHPLVESGSLSAKALENERWVIREIGSGTREATEKLFTKLSIHPSGVMEFGSTQLIKESVEAGLGITCLSQLAIQKELAMGVLKIIQVEGIPMTRKFSIVLGSAYQTKAVQCFVELLKTSDVFHKTYSNNRYLGNQ